MVLSLLSRDVSRPIEQNITLTHSSNYRLQNLINLYIIIQITLYKTIVCYIIYSRSYIDRNIVKLFLIYLRELLISALISYLRLTEIIVRNIRDFLAASATGLFVGVILVLQIGQRLYCRTVGVALATTVAVQITHVSVFPHYARQPAYANICQQDH